jgi:subtilisin-like proprotein convertase family protein
VAVQILPPELTLEETESFDNGLAPRLAGESTGNWLIYGGTLTGSPLAGADRAFTQIDLSVDLAYLMRTRFMVSTDSMAGIAFDRYDETDFKFAALSVETDEVLIGHYTKRNGWVIDASAPFDLNAGQAYELEVTAEGLGVNVVVDGETILGYAFNAPLMDGTFGLLTGSTASTFDDLTIMTNDPAYEGGSTNTDPAPNGDALASVEDQSLVISEADLLANDTDNDGDTLVITGMSQPQNGTLTDNGDGTWTYVPDADFAGIDNFTYTVSDGNGGTGTAVVGISVTGVNDAPEAVDNVVDAVENQPLVIPVADLLGNDADIDGDNIYLASFTQPSSGSLTHNGDGTLTYIPTSGFTGVDGFTYTISDGNGEYSTASVAVNVQKLNPKHTYTESPGQSIRDMKTITSTIVVGDSYTIHDINVILNITHAAAQDLDVYLIAPDGTRVELFTDVGGNNDNFLNTELDDAAAVSITDGTAPFTGVFRPEGDLSVLEGMQVDGTWTLEITDDKRRNSGTLDSWSLVVEEASSMEAVALAVDSSAAMDLQQAELDDMVSAVIEEWSASGQISANERRVLEAATFRVGELQDKTLGIARSGVVTIDANASGWGWFVDMSPGEHEEFGSPDESGTMLADVTSSAYGRMDLYTVVSHELGHIIGLEHDQEGYGFMSETLSAGTRLVSGLWSDHTFLHAEGEDSLNEEDEADH